ncbi:50S ribosomal protein L10 [bacterium]|nr:50S ribosomal protein L10 [bacterium]
MPSEKKINIVNELKESFQQNNAVFITDYMGLSVENITKLRAKLKENDSFMIVAKNRLIKIALQELKRDMLESYLKGPTALVFSKDSPVNTAKVINDYFEEFNKPEVRGMVIDEEELPVEYFTALAKLPPREVLEAQLVNVLASPIIRIVSVAHNLLQNFVVVLNQIANKKN